MINDIVRGIKIKRMSRGQGHPELVPVGGSKAHPQNSGKGSAKRDSTQLAAATRRSKRRPDPGKRGTPRS